MTIPKELTTVTSVSKILAAVLFIIFPFAGFYIGLQYEHQFTKYLEDRTTVDRYIIKPSPIATQSESAAKNYCEYSNIENQKIESVWDCRDFKVLNQNCCDFPDIILDKNGNKIMECGGKAGYSKECAKFGHSPKSCSYIKCSIN